jgi:hypothetical protein
MISVLAARASELEDVAFPRGGFDGVNRNHYFQGTMRRSPNEQNDSHLLKTSTDCFKSHSARPKRSVCGFASNFM